jgi:hypothetical protein
MCLTQCPYRAGPSTVINANMLTMGIIHEMRGSAQGFPTRFSLEKKRNNQFYSSHESHTKANPIPKERGKENAIPHFNTLYRHGSLCKYRLCVSFYLGVKARVSTIVNYMRQVVRSSKFLIRTQVQDPTSESE